MTDEQGPILGKPLRLSRRVCIAVLIVLAVVGGLAGFIRWQTNSFRARAQSIKVGDSKARVEKLLGHPTKIFLPDPQSRTDLLVYLLSVHSETWAYGSSFDKQSEFPYFSPRSRWFR